MDRKISLFFLIFVIFFIALFTYASKEGLRGPIEKEEEEANVKTYAVQSHEYYDDLVDLKYVITSKDELKVFKNAFEGELKLDDVNFDKNTVFIQLEIEGSGSVQKEITDFIIDSSVAFVVKTKSEGVGTDDMALWYYIAIVPNSKLKDVNYSAWQTPSAVIKNYEDKYVITTDSKYLTMRDDGGSNTNIYYEIDTKNNIISKYIEVYEANLTGTPETKLDNIYEKDFNIDDLVIIDKIYHKEDIKDTDIPFKINGKNIYNQDSINQLKELLDKYENA